MIQLISKTGETYQISREAAKYSDFISTMIEDDQSDEIVLNINNVENDNLERIVRYLNFHEGNPPVELAKPVPLKKNKTFAEYAGEFDAGIIAEVCPEENSPQCDKHEGLFRLINDARYLGITPLYELGAAREAYFLKSFDNIYEPMLFYGVKPLTAEEQEKVDKECAWIFDYTS